MSSRTSLSYRRSRGIQRGSQRGYSLVELAIVLAIIAAIIVGALVGVQRIIANNRANATLSDVPRVSAALVGIATNSGSLAALDTTAAIKLGVFSPETIKTDPKTGQYVENPFGSRYYVRGAVDPVGTIPAGRSFVVRIDGVPLSMCGTLTSGLSTIARGIWVNTLGDSEGKVTVPADASLVKDPAKDTAVSLTNLASSCGSTGAADTGLRTVNVFFSAV